MKNNKKFFWFLLLTYLLVAASDLGLTYIGSPDLSNEANPLVTILGFGWKALIISDIMFFMFYVWLAYFSLIQYKRVTIKCEGIKQFVSLFLYDRPDKFAWILWRLPVNKAAWKRALAPIGYSLSLSLVIAKTVLIVEWIGIINESYIVYWYFQNINVLPGLVYLLVLVISFLGFSSYWFYKEFKINEQELKRQDIFVSGNSIIDGEHV
jgi:hypothetical protein